MNIIIFGASGMVGQGVLLECLRDPQVRGVLSVVRSPTGQKDEKLRERVVENFFDFSPFASEFSGFDACFFCLGVSSMGMTEDAYRRVTYDITVGAAELLARLNPGMTFIYVSGTGTDSTERGRVMWARVKGRTENALRRLPFKAAYMFRPGVIIPQDGIRSKTAVYRMLYVIAAPLLPILKKLFPKYMTTTQKVGRAMIEAARQGAPQAILESVDINRLAEQS